MKVLGFPRLRADIRPGIHAPCDATSSKAHNRLRIA
jgi:hypothetical protein